MLCTVCTPVGSSSSATSLRPEAATASRTRASRSSPGYSGGRMSSGELVVTSSPHPRPLPQAWEKGARVQKRLHYPTFRASGQGDHAGSPIRTPPSVSHLLGQVSAVDRKDRASDERGIVGGEEENRL